MKDDLKYIDEYYKNRLDGYSGETATGVWNKLKWTLFWLRYRWYIISALAILLLGSSTAIWYNLPEKSNSQNNIVEQTTSLTEHIAYSQNETNEIKQYDQPANSNNEKTIFSDEIAENQPQQKTINQNPTTEEIVLKTETPIAINDEFVETYSITTKSNISGFNSLFTKTHLAVEPDTSIFGYNLRTVNSYPESKKQRLSINVYCGPSYSESVITGSNTDYIVYRNENESNHQGWSVGTDLRFHIKNWIISTGINYSVYNQYRSYQHIYKEYLPESSYYYYDTTWVWIFDPPEVGTPMVASVDSSWIEVHDFVTIDNSGVNQLKYFEIPLLIGYRHNSNMFSYEFTTGVSAGFLVYSKMKVPDFSKDYDFIETEQMNHTMFNFVSRASVYYHLDQKTSLFISPYFKQNLQSVFEKNYPVNQQYRTFGVNFGVSVLF